MLNVLFQGAEELREEGLWSSSEPQAVGGRAEDLPLWWRGLCGKGGDAKS